VGRVIKSLTMIRPNVDRGEHLATMIDKDHDRQMIALTAAREITARNFDDVATVVASKTIRT